MKRWGMFVSEMTGNVRLLLALLFLSLFLLNVDVSSQSQDGFSTQPLRAEFVLIGLFGAQNALGARRRTQSVPAGNQRATRRKVRPVVTLAVVFTLGFIMLITISRIVMTVVYPEGFVSALKPYQSIQPGIALSTIKPYNCGPHYFSHDTREEKCDLELVGAKLNRVTLTLQGDKVDKVTFVSSSAQVGDLIQIWGRPNSIVNKHGIFTLRWDSGILAIAKGSHSFSYQLPIETAILT